MPKTSATLENLINKALQKGEARKKNPHVKTQGHVQYFGNADHNTFNAENQWKIDVTKDTNGLVKEVFAYHYDVLIAQIKNDGNGYQLVDWYGKGPTDRDALNQLADKFNLPQSFYIKGGDIKESINV